MRSCKKIILPAVLCLFAVFVLVANQASAKTYTLRVGSYDQKNHHLIQKVWLPYCAEIEKRTNGQVKFKWYHAGSLLKAGQTYKGLVSGLADFVPFVAIWSIESQFPVSQVFTLPFMFESTTQLDKTYAIALKTIPELKKEYAKIKLIGFHTTDFANVSLVVPPPKKMADMKGMKIWAGSRTMVNMLKLSGATPRSVKLSDLYMALQRKSLDGVLFPTAPLAVYKLTDVVNNHTVMKASVGLVPSAMNLKTWNSLPPDIQAVFIEMSPSLTSLLGSITDHKRVYMFRQLKKRGDTIHYLTDAEKQNWRKSMQPIYDAWLEQMKSKGIDGQTVLDRVRDIASEVQDISVKEANWWVKDWKD